MRISYSFSYTRELNLHRSKEQLEREFTNIEDSTAEFAEFVHHLNKDIKKHITKYAGVKKFDLPEMLYVVIRDRGLSYPDPLTVVYDDNQKLMFVRYVNVLCQKLFVQPEAALLLTQYVCGKLPLSVEHELRTLEEEQHITLPLRYDLEEKALKKWLK